MNEKLRDEEGTGWHWLCHCVVITSLESQQSRQHNTSEKGGSKEEIYLSFASLTMAESTMVQENTSSDSRPYSQDSSNNNRNNVIDATGFSMDENAPVVNPGEFVTALQSTFQQMQDRFTQMMDSVMERMDEMADRLGDLEREVTDLVSYAGGINDQVEPVGRDAENIPPFKDETARST